MENLSDCASSGAADIPVVVCSAGSHLLLWIFKCDGSGGLLFPHFIWRIVGEQPVEAKKGRKENGTAWRLAGGRG